MRRWAPDEDALIRERYEATTNEELRQLLPGRTLYAIALRACSFGIKKNHEHRAAHARRTYREAAAKTGGKPGHQPKPIGSTHRKGRYIHVKVAEPNVWIPLHVHEWVMANGAVPEGMIVAARDGNVRNAVLENLCLRTIAENNLRRNINYRHLPEEIVDCLHLQYEIKKEIERRTDREEQAK